MSTFELHVVAPGTENAPAALRDGTWRRAARTARLLAWFSLAWMSIEGVVGILAGIQAHSLGVLTWAASSFVEALASLIIVWRFTGHRTLSTTSEARAQKWIAGSFFVLAPYFTVEAIRTLAAGNSDTHPTALAITLTATAIVLMPLLGWTKLRLAQNLSSTATAGEGVQNLMCAAQAAAALAALAGAAAGLTILDPIAALLIAATALKEGASGWQGRDTCCTPAAAVADAPPVAATCPDGCC